nr:alpha/beta fold hydrolase [uncultured Methanomethylovorans sp.]
MTISVQAAVPKEEWKKNYSTNFNYGFSAAITSDGGSIIVGTVDSNSTNGYHDVFMIKTDSNGNEEWKKIFGGSAEELVYSVSNTSDGGFIIAGSYYGSSGMNGAWLVKFDSNGNQEWNHIYGGHKAYSVSQTSDGGYVFGGHIWGGYSQRSPWMLKTDTNGIEQFNKTYSSGLYTYSGDSGYIYSVMQTSDGGYILAGDTESDATGGTWLIKTDGNGNMKWSRQFGTSGLDYLSSVIQTSDGGYVVIQNGIDYYNSFHLIKTDNYGIQEWDRTFSGEKCRAHSVSQTLDGGYIIAGEIIYDYSNFDACLIKTNSSGYEQWSKISNEIGKESGFFATQTSDGGYIFAGGRHLEYWDDETFLIKYDSDSDLNFTSYPSKIRISDNVEFNASQYVSSTDSITWDFGDGETNSSNSPIVYHSYSEPGSYTAKLTVTDSTGKGVTKSQFVNITIPVVLVHGFMSSSETWVDMSSALQENDFEVWNFDYGDSSTQNPQDIVPKLSDYIDEKRNDLSYNGQKYNGSIDIVCHSMGAIVSRLYMENYQGGIHGKEVRQWIGIAPAHGGSAGADCYMSEEQFSVTYPKIYKLTKWLSPGFYAKWYRLYLKIGPAVNELKTDSDSVKILSTGSLSQNTKYRVLVGWNPTHSKAFGNGTLSATLAKRTSGSGSLYYWTYSGDMIVATAQSYDARIKNFEAFPIDGKLGSSPAEEFDHVHITKSPTVIQYVIGCLKDINKSSSNTLPSDDEIQSLTFFQKRIVGILHDKQQVNLPVPKLISTSSNAVSNLNVVSNSLTNAQDTSSSQENVVLDVILEWDDGDVSVNLISPSGTVYSADSHASNVGYFKDENSLNYIVPDPESGNWTAELIPEEYPGHDIHYNLTYSLESIGSDGSNYYPVANFTTNVTTGFAPLTVQFTDLSTNAISWKWDFGDGTSSTEQDPVHIYTKEGSYTVSLNSSNSIGYSTKQTTIAVKSNSVSTSTASYSPTYDNRLRSGSPTSVLSTTTYLDIGRSSATVRDLLLFDLSSYKTTDTISKATLSLYWYYPAGATRTSETVVEVYRPVEWDPKYVTWNSRASGTLWTTAGGNWYDKNAVSQGTTPYASTTFTASTVPDNKYYEFDVTQLVQEYVSGKYANTGFFLKAKTESGNYIAFYSSEASNTAVRPKLTITSVSGSTSVDNPPVANAGADKTATVGTSVTFDGSASTDDKGIASYSWDFDLSNGITAEATTMIASKTYTTVGTYTATLTVTDTAGQKSTDTVQIVVNSATSPVSTVSYSPTYDNRLRSASPTSVLSTTTYLDIGRSSATIRDLLLFDLSSYKTTDTISKATLSLYWYYPAGTTRTSDTVVEVYRPVEWDPKYVTWNSRVSGTLWTTAGGNWYDKNSIAQGTTPYASVTFAGTKLPDNKYYEFDVTQLVQEYVSGKYKNTGFFLKAKTESGNYIAFYSADASNTAVRPKLTITS